MVVQAVCHLKYWYRLQHLQRTIHLNEAMLVFVTHDHYAALCTVAIGLSPAIMSACQTFTFV